MSFNSPHFVMEREVRLVLPFRLSRFRILALDSENDVSFGMFCTKPISLMPSDSMDSPSSQSITESTEKSFNSLQYSRVSHFTPFMPARALISVRSEPLRVSFSTPFSAPSPSRLSSPALMRSSFNCPGSSNIAATSPGDLP